MELLPWNRLDGPAVARSFISWQAQAYQKRVHACYEYQGSADQTRLRLNRLPEDEIMRRIAELFNLADPSYHPLSVIMHTYKLIRPAPKVPRAPVFCVDHIGEKKHLL
jgi:hypothetical protein